MDISKTEFAYVDVETTGANITSDRIIEIAIITTKNGEILNKFTTCVNPEVHVPEEILALTGLTKHEIMRSPTFFEIKAQIKEILNGKVFVAHNARFDYGVLRREFLRYSDSFKAKVLCTVKLSRNLYPQHRHHNLDKIIERHNIVCTNRHRAEDDALVLVKFIKKISKEFDSETLASLIKAQTSFSSLPLFIKRKQFDDLPEGPGVYTFSGKDGSILYIGKSVNIKERVRSHFNSAHTINTDYKLSKNAYSIQAIETAGDISASIKESQMIKELFPLFNRVSRRKRLLPAAISLQKGKYPGVKLENVDMQTIKEPEKILSFFKNQRSAKNTLYEICKTHNLCPKLTGLENGKSSCFYRQLGYCNGACIGAENPLKYKMRFIQAFSGTKVSSWPFDTPVLIKEAYFDVVNMHLFSNWCYLGTLEEVKGKILKFIKASGYFDHDLYRIIKRAIYSGKAKIEIIPMDAKMKKYCGDVLHDYSL